MYKGKFDFFTILSSANSTITHDSGVVVSPSIDTKRTYVCMYIIQVKPKNI